MPKNYKTIPLLGSDYAERSGEVNSQKTVNLWQKITKPGAKAQIILYPPPGLTKFSVTGDSANRGNGVKFNGYGYFVVGSSFVQVDTDGIETIQGTLDTSSGRIQMKAGRDYIMIVDGASGWTWDGSTFAKITDLDFPSNPSHVAYLNNYFIINKGSSDEFYISALEDPTSWGALDFEAASAVPDNASALAANTKDLYILGSDSTQVYFYSGNAAFPFGLYTSGILDFGILAPQSLSESSVGIFMLATAKEGGIAVVQIVGFNPIIISEDISWDLENFSTVDDAEGFVYRIGSRTIYQINFPAQARTFEYIVESQSWSERKSKNDTRYLTNGHLFLGTKNIVGSYNSGVLYLMDENVYTDDGEALERVRVTQPIHVDHNKIKYNSVVLEIESGVGTVSGEGLDPMITMRYSDDGGKVWSSELTASMGKTGERGIILEWHKLGTAITRIFEFKCGAPVKTVFINAYANVRVLRG